MLGQSGSEKSSVNCSVYVQREVCGIISPFTFVSRGSFEAIVQHLISFSLSVRSEV